MHLSETAFMRITNIKIKDFRNIVRADINFGKINILTGKNSSGKSNFLLALSQALSSEKDYTDIFKNNVVTYHPGKDYASIYTTVGDINSNVCYILNNDRFFCIDPKEFGFEKDIDKRGMSKNHRLFFTGRYFENDKNPELRWPDFKLSSHLYKSVERELVYNETFNQELQQSATKVVQISRSSIPHQDEYWSFFSDLNTSVVSWVDKTDEIHQFVTERGTREIYDQVLERLKSRRPEGSFTPSNTLLDKAKFIFLLADLQRSGNEKYYANFINDLKTYTKGIVAGIAISPKGGNKGEIAVTSPNGPGDIWTISHGTSVLIFFILLLNWARLPAKEKSYKSPNVLIFDEIDSLIHPTLMPEFKEVLKLLSQSVQLFMTTHSPYFIDGFEKEELFLLKDTPSLPGTKKLANRCNIYDYNKIISSLPEKDREMFFDKKNSQLFVDGLIDEIFPNKQYD